MGYIVGITLVVAVLSYMIFKFIKKVNEIS